MKKTIPATITLVGVGIIIGILLVSSLSPDLMDNLLAGEIIGKDKAPVAVNDYAKALNKAYVDASSAVVPTVVSISVMLETEAPQNHYNDEFKKFFERFGVPFDSKPDGGSSRRSYGGGSGVFVSQDGYIVTNNHVVGNAVEISVTTSERKEYKAKLVGKDPLTDLAVLKVEGTGFPIVHFADSDSIQVGDLVIAVGNPFGLNSTVTNGMISAIGRGGLSMSRDRSGYSVEHFIQTDAPINPGNSGGGLFNLQGSLVGINTAIATRTGTYMGYGFAIPVDLTKSVVEDLIEDGKVNRGYIGVRIETVDEVYAKSAGLDEIRGVLVQGVLDDSPAKAGGIQMGDIILEVDKVEVFTSNELQSRITLKRAGDKVKLTIWRDGKKIYKTVKLKAKDDDGNLADTDSDSDEEEAEQEVDETIDFEDLGFTIDALTKEQKKDFNVKGGAFISKVERYSIAEQRRLFPGGVIFKANKKKISSTRELKKIIDSKKPGSAILLYIKYRDSDRIVALEIPEEREDN